MSLVQIVLLALASCLLVANAKSMTAEEKQAMHKDLVANCKAQEGASDTDIQEMITHQPPSTRPGQCLNACVMENIGFIKDGKLSVEGSVKIAEMTGDATRVKNVELISKECQSAVGADRCDTALQIMQCVGQAAVAHGLDPSKDLM